MNGMMRWPYLPQINHPRTCNPLLQSNQASAIHLASLGRQSSQVTVTLLMMRWDERKNITYVWIRGQTPKETAASVGTGCGCNEECWRHTFWARIVACVCARQSINQCVEKVRYIIRHIEKKWNGHKWIHMGSVCVLCCDAAVRPRYRVPTPEQKGLEVWKCALNPLGFKTGNRYRSGISHHAR